MGLTLGALSAGFTAWMWLHAAQGGWGFFPALFPFVAVLGFALVLFPGHLTERYRRGEDLSQVGGIRAVTVRWWAIVLVALVVGWLDLAAFPRP